MYKRQLFPGNANEQTSLKPLEGKVLQDFGCTKFIYCSDCLLYTSGTEEILAVVVGEYTECDGGDPAVILEQNEQG